MMNWIKTKIRYTKPNENGRSDKTVNEVYLVCAETFSEAETRIIDEREPYLNSECQVSAVSKIDISELFYNPNEEHDIWYMIKWGYYSTLEKTTSNGCVVAEKKVMLNSLAQAESVKEAIVIFENGMKDFNGDYEIVSVAETDIIEVYKAKE